MSASSSSEKLYKDVAASQDGASSNGHDSDKKKNCAAQTPSKKVLDSIVFVRSREYIPDYCFPWKRKIQYSYATGVIISGRRIIARLDRWSTGITLKRHNSDKIYAARILSPSLTWLVALLTVEDESFWKNDSFLTCSTLPKRGVLLRLLQLTGDDVSITNHTMHDVMMFDRISNTLMTLYSIAVKPPPKKVSSGHLLLNELDEVVGLAYGESKEHGIAISTATIELFFRDFEEHGRFTGFACNGFKWKAILSPSLRQYKKMNSDGNGILVLDVFKTSPASKVLLEGDVVLSIDDSRILEDGQVAHFGRENNIDFDYLFQSKLVGESVKLGILRDGERMEVKYALGDWYDTTLVPFHPQKCQPDYYICGGFVFLALSHMYMRAASEKGWLYPLREWTREKQFVDEEVVVMSSALEPNCSSAYNSNRIQSSVVSKFNGVKLRNVRHLAQLVECCDKDHFIFEFQQGVVILSRDEAVKGNDFVLEKHCIPTHTNLKGLDKPSLENLLP